MASPLESWRQRNPEFDYLPDYQVLRGLYDQHYSSQFESYEDFKNNFNVDPASLETQRFGR